MADDITEKRGYPLPVSSHNVSDDVAGLRSAFEKIDADVDSVVTGLAGKAASDHTHAISEVDGLTEALAGKTDSDHHDNLDDLADVDVTGAPTGSIIVKTETGWEDGNPASVLGAHEHAISDVQGLQGVLDTKAPLASPALTGTPTVPTAAPGTNTIQAASTAFVAAAIAALLDSTPATLDTLNELAAALGDDPNFATTITNLIAGKLAKSANLGDVDDPAAARINLGLAIGTPLPPIGTAGQSLRVNSDATGLEYSSGWEHIGTYAPNNVPNVDIIDLAAYRVLRITGQLLPATDATIYLRTSADNGATFAQGALDYTNQRLTGNGNVASASSAQDTGFRAGVIQVGSAANEGVQFTLTVTEFNVANRCYMRSEAFARDGASNSWAAMNVGFHDSTTPRNALQVICASGNIASGFFIVEGIKA